MNEVADRKSNLVRATTKHRNSVKLRRTDEMVGLVSKIISDYHERIGQPISRRELRRKRVQTIVAIEQAAKKMNH